MAMRRPWWRNIRWRLALGSMLVALLSAGLLALTAILVINYYYGSEQQSSLSYLAHDKAQSVGILYAQAIAYFYSNSIKYDGTAHK